MENKRSVKDNFFVIDSENFTDAKSELYGYCITDTNVDRGGGYNTLLNDEAFYTKTYNGAFVMVQNFKDKVCISQDFIGCWGLYLFRSGDYWAVSNSFLYLVEYLKTRFVLTPNVDYMKLSILYGLCSCLPQETAIKEIEMLPRNTYIVIDKKSKKIEISENKTDEGIFALSEKEGITTLDKWFLKWTHFIKNICPKIDYKIQTDLSGGFESRMVLMLFLCSGIDVDKIRVNSIDDNLHCHTEDYNIANELAEHFGFILNGEPIKIERKNFSLEDTIDISFYIKLGFHKEMYLKYSWSEDVCYSFIGAGANLKEDDVLDFTLEEFLATQKKKQENLNLDFDLYSGFEKCVGNCEDFLLKKYGNLDGKCFGRRIYQEGRNRHHYGKAMAECWISNNIAFAPMLDSLIQKLKFNYDFPNLIPAVMFTRYCPDLLNFKFQGKRFINQETLDFAKKINEQFPFKPENYTDKFNNFEIIFEKNVYKTVKDYSGKEPIQITDYQPFSTQRNVSVYADPVEWCKKLFRSNFVKRNFCQLFTKRVYNRAEKYIHEHPYFPLAEAYAVIAIAKIVYDTNYSQGVNGDGTFDFLKAMVELPDDGTVEDENLYTLGQVYSTIEILHTARFDIKLENAKIPNSNIALEVVSPKENCKVSTPQWFAKDGIGYIVECSGYEMELCARCKNDGVLKSFLRAKDVRNNGVRIPIFIDYENLEINEKKLLEKATPCSHDKPFRYEMPVRTGDEIKIKLSWNAHKYADGEGEEILLKILER